MKRFTTVKELCQIALLAALIAVCAWISIPAAVPFTLQTFAVFLAVGLCGTKCGTLSVAVYILLGAVGLPVFSGFGSGLGTLLGATGGYIVGFLPAAFLSGLLMHKSKCGLFRMILAMAAGLVVCYALGSVWFAVVYAARGNAMQFSAILAMCVLPYIPVDAVKIALAALLSARLKKLTKFSRPEV